MKTAWDGAVCCWERFCGLMMGVALVIALISLGPRWSRTESELYMSSWYDLVILEVWIFACVGLFLSHLNNAKGRVPMTIAGFGASAVCCGWEAYAFGCESNEICAIYAAEHSLAALVCLLIMCLLIAYDELKERPRLVKIIFSWLGRLLMVAWLCALLYGVVAFIVA